MVLVCGMVVVAETNKKHFSTSTEMTSLSEVVPDNLVRWVIVKVDSCLLYPSIAM
jgi:hypothetical protein